MDKIIDILIVIWLIGLPIALYFATAYKTLLKKSEEQVRVLKDRVREIYRIQERKVFFVSDSVEKARAYYEIISRLQGKINPSFVRFISTNQSERDMTHQMAGTHLADIFVYDVETPEIVKHLAKSSRGISVHIVLEHSDGDRILRHHRLPRG